MKRSRYTYSCDGESREHLLFNTAFGSFAILDDEAFSQFLKCEGPLVDQMLEDGFLTDLSDADELAAQQAMFEATRADNGDFYLVVAPTYACNLRCPYCYEQGHNGIKGKMSPDVMDATISFVKSRYFERPFKRLFVQWYGGDPSLALDVVESLSERFIAWCDETGVEYRAMMLSNCNVIDENAVALLVRARVGHVYMTIDGFEETHNARRVSATGLNSFQKNIEAARLFKANGIRVQAVMNVDRVNWPEYRPLRDMLREEFDVELGFARLCDYGHFYGTRDFKKPAFDLFDHDEFCKLRHDEFVDAGFDAEKLRGLLQAAPIFCNGQRNNYYIVDTLGDVYICDGYIGEKGHMLFNVKDEPTPEQQRTVSHNPYESAQCRDCWLLPICQGNCDWERRATGMPCHPLLTTLHDYLRDYRSCFGDATGPYKRLA